MKTEHPTIRTYESTQLSCAKEERRISPEILFVKSDFSATAICKKCKKTLPLSYFYKRGKGALDYYCKSCRCMASKKQYAKRIATETTLHIRHSFVEERDKGKRMLLLLQAKRKVKESVERKTQLRREQEEAEFFS